ncbi:hypothetical protein DFH07DRAFT_1066738 [Mycena maculata]|uniref:Uncharacterized protein n=1 Tax=Mycena maculata TaxID=230809 RepID=A0AAD7MP10_9AGAR|nr:hypothetical protein DFH07DRAFT_1066738 [Mycena maculata]
MMLLHAMILLHATQQPDKLLHGFRAAAIPAHRWHHRVSAALIATSPCTSMIPPGVLGPTLFYLCPFPSLPSLHTRRRRADNICCDSG